MYENQVLHAASDRSSQVISILLLEGNVDGVGKRRRKGLRRCRRGDPAQERTYKRYVAHVASQALSPAWQERGDEGGPKAEKSKEILLYEIHRRNTVLVWEKRKEEENKDACKPNPVDQNKVPAQPRLLWA